jgi:SAM-dependent methyltransferase
MTGITPRPAKSHAELKREWDRLAEERHRQIASGEDLSFEHVVVPTIWRLFEGVDCAVVLEIGSGTGDFTARLAKVSGKVIAIEPSRASMALARKVCQRAENIMFIETTLEKATNKLHPGSVTAAVAVMTLMTAPDLRGFANALAAILPRGASFVAAITHPWFWPKYWEYEKEPWFHYEREIFIEAPFVISRRHTEIRTTHIHRPLEQYINVFAEEGFRLSELLEPMATAQVQSLYPEPWQFPRFLGLRWEKVVSTLSARNKPPNS